MKDAPNNRQNKRQKTIKALFEGIKKKEQAEATPELDRLAREGKRKFI